MGARRRCGTGGAIPRYRPLSARVLVGWGGVVAGGQNAPYGRAAHDTHPILDGQLECARLQERAAHNVHARQPVLDLGSAGGGGDLSGIGQGKPHAQREGCLALARALKDTASQHVL
eukprot:scaffold12285_cov136-Isochrysis_galbana.AAC.4